MSEKHPTLALADALATCVKTYPQLSEDEPGGYVEEFDQMLDDAVGRLRTQHADLLRKDALLSKCLKHVASNISMNSDGTEAEDLYDAIQQELSQ